MTFLSIYPVIFGPFRTAQEIHERGVVEVNIRVAIRLLYFKKGVERAEVVDADVPIFQTKYRLNGTGTEIIIAFDQNIVQT